MLQKFKYVRDLNKSKPFVETDDPPFANTFIVAGSSDRSNVYLLIHDDIGYIFRDILQYDLYLDKYYEASDDALDNAIDIHSMNIYYCKNLIDLYTEIKASQTTK